MTPRARALMALAKAAAPATPDVSYLGPDDLAGNVPEPDGAQQQNDDTATDAVIVLIALWLASRSAVGARFLPDDLIRSMTGIGIDPKAAREAGALGLSVPLTGRNRHGSPLPYAGMPFTRAAAAMEPGMRARYIIAAAQRLTAAIGPGFGDALDREKTYLDQHRDAGRRRRAAAARYDAVAKRSTTGWLVWRTAEDDRVTPDCAALDGRVFPRDQPPGMPGAMHSNCRCAAEPYGPTNHAA